MAGDVPAVRVFIAVELPPDVRAALAGPVRLLRADSERAGLSAAWSRPEGWHVTLKFLGAVAADRLPAITERLAEAAGHHHPFTIHLEGFGAFPSPSRPRVLWIGVTDDEGRAALSALAGRIEAAIAPLGYPAEARPFHPHITVTRIDQPRLLPRLSEFLERSGTTRLATVEVRRVALMKSEPRAGGAVYTAMSYCDLLAKRL